MEAVVVVTTDIVVQKSCHISLRVVKIATLKPIVDALGSESGIGS